MDIAALSMGLSQMKAQQEASMSVMKMAMDSAKGQANDMTKMLEANARIKTRCLSRTYELILGERSEYHGYSSTINGIKSNESPTGS